MTWEYMRVAEGGSYGESELNSLGAIEWELVCFDMHGAAYFKRQKKVDALNACAGETIIVHNDSNEDLIVPIR